MRLRGLAIALMIFVNNPGDHDAMPSQFVHADWHGFRLAELVFPLFLFSAGISMALSRRSGAARPDAAAHRPAGRSSGACWSA